MDEEDTYRPRLAWVEWHRMHRPFHLGLVRLLSLLALV